MARPILFFLCILASLSAFAQDSLASEPWIRKSSFIPIPIVYYTPETGFAGGAALSYAFRFRKQPDEARPSQIQLGLAYTQENQILAYLPFQVFLQDGAWQAYGELGYYRYIYQFFGLGNATATADLEYYSVTFPRVRLNLLRRIAPNQYLGPRYWWDDFRINQVLDGGLLQTGGITGSSGGVISAAGVVWIYDSRDNLFFPSRGILAEGEFLLNSPWLGSDYSFRRFSMDAGFYFSKTPRHVLALNGWLVMMEGDPPFQQLAFIGGPRKMRGYFEGRFRDRNLWMFQAEYRVQVWGRLGMAAFGGMGAVSPDPISMVRQPVHFTFGAGLRFRLSKSDPINLRLDVAGNEQGEFFPYLTVKEAF